MKELHHTRLVVSYIPSSDCSLVLQDCIESFNRLDHKTNKQNKIKKTYFIINRDSSANAKSLRFSHQDFGQQITFHGYLCQAMLPYS